MIVTQKQLKTLMETLDLDILEGYLEDSYAIRKFILGCETGINDLKIANEETDEPLDIMINKNLIKEFENQIILHEETKEKLRQQVKELK